MRDNQLTSGTVCYYIEKMERLLCVSCQGTGFRQFTNSYGELETRSCVDCFGTGYLNGNSGIQGTRMMQSRCISCQGTGFRQFTNIWGEPETRICVDCKGTGYMIPGWGT